MRDIKIVCGDAMETMARLAPGSVDLLLTDPPYGKTRLDWDKTVDWPAFWDLAERACKPSATMAVFLTQPAAQPMIQANRSAFRYELIWHKNSSMGFLDARKRPLRAHENIYIFCREYGVGKAFKATYNPVMKAGQPYNKRRRAAFYSQYGHIIGEWETHNDGKRYPTSVLFFNRPQHGEHPTQKPIKLLRWLVATYSMPGNLVLDPYGGSGTTAVACAEFGRRCLLVERSADYCAVARRRVKEAMEAGPLPEEASACDAP